MACPLNEIIWKSITLALKSKNLPVENWEIVLQNALHSIRSLLCTAINATPHERFCNFPRRSTNGQSMPTWLLEQGKVFVKKHFQSSKYDPLVEETDLIEAEPQYAYIKYPNGRESNVSIKDLAPLEGDKKNPHPNPENTDKKDSIHSEYTPQVNKPLITDRENLLDTVSEMETHPEVQPSPFPRRSQRNRKAPQRFGFEEN